MGSVREGEKCAQHGCQSVPHGYSFTVKVLCYISDVRCCQLEHVMFFRAYSFPVLQNKTVSEIISKQAFSSIVHGAVSDDRMFSSIQ